MAMTTLDATVEIVKTAISTSAASNNSSLITYAETRKNLLEGIEAIYKKLDELQGYGK